KRPATVCRFASSGCSTWSPRLLEMQSQKAERRPEPPSAYGVTNASGSGGESLHLGREVALMSRGFIAGDGALVGDAVDGRGLGLEDRDGGLLVARGDRLLHFLDRAAQLGAQAHVGRALLDGLASAFRGLLGVRHCSRSFVGRVFEMKPDMIHDLFKEIK